MTNIAISLARYYLSGSVSNLTSNAINKFKRKISGKTGVRTGFMDLLYLLRMKI